MTLIKTDRHSPRTLFDSPLRLLDSFPQFFNTELEAARGWMPPVDVAESENELLFKVELPGFDRDDFNIAVEDGTLTISGERTQEVKDENLHRVERSYGRFERSFSLPRNVDPEKIDAILKNGLLTITLPRREETKPRQIPVNVQ